LRKVSAKQHYLSVARYVAGQSTNLPSRYRKFRHLVERILIACAILIVGRLLVQSRIGQNRFSGLLMNLFEFAPFVKNRAIYAGRVYYAIMCRSIYTTLTNIVQYRVAVFLRILFSFNIFLRGDFFIGMIYRIFWINATYFLYLRRTLLIRFVKYVVERFTIITN
jgi:hypothetical protein